MSYLKAIKRGVAAAQKKPAPQKYKSSAELITCSHCGGDQFWPFNFTKFASEGLLREHYSLECVTCSHLEMFAKQPTEIDNAG
jgi:hypothetical protein